MGKFICALLLCAGIFLSGCASYQAASLSALNPEYVREYDEVKGVSIGCKSFTNEDCDTYLDRNVLKEGYQPIQLTFYNQTDNNYLFSTDKVGLPCAQPERVAKKVHTSTIGRIAGYTAGAFLLTPLIIPAVVDGICSHEANKKLDNDFSNKANTHFIIPPRSFRTSLIFVPKDKFTPVFEVSLLEQETQKDKIIRLTATQ